MACGVNRQLCEVCARIDLKHDCRSIDLASRGGFPRILHYDSFASMVSASHGCELCALVVEGLTSLEEEFGAFGLNTPVYRSVECAKLEDGPFRDEARRFICLNFGDKWHLTGPYMNCMQFCQIELFVDEDSTLARRQDVLGRLIRPAEDPTTLLTWLRDCGECHERCKAPCHDGQPQYMPTRLIDVGAEDSRTVKLVTGVQCAGAYATLSHCWGKSSRTNTLKATLSTYMTSLDLSALCKTMRDAIVVTRNTGLRYIWIDALCIVQDDPEDWEREAMTMSEVYTQAFLNIAASSAPDGDGGCFFARVDPPMAYLHWTISDELPPETVSFRTHLATRFHRYVENAPLNERAWVLQERMLSRRVVHFTHDRLYWECQESRFEEGLMKKNKYEPWRGDPRAYQLAMNSATCQEPGDTRFVEAQWLDVVGQYSKTKLTYASDRLPALAGLAMVWAQRLGDQYVAGCWQRSLPLSLLWVKELNVGLSHPLRGPSWSWATFDGAVTYPDTTRDRAKSLVQDVEILVDGRPAQSVFGGVSSGALVLTGRLKSVVFTGDRTENEYDQHMPWLMALDPDRRFVHRRASFDYEPILNQPLQILQLCADESPWEFKEHGLLLQPLQRPNEFRRLGLGVIVWERHNADGDRSEDSTQEETSWFDDASLVRLTIV